MNTEEEIKCHTCPKLVFEEEKEENPEEEAPNPVPNHHSDEAIIAGLICFIVFIVGIVFASVFFAFYLRQSYRSLESLEDYNREVERLIAMRMK